MKRYELMTSKQVLSAYAGCRSCETCILKNKLYYACIYEDCVLAITKYLNEDIEMIKKWKKIKCNDDLVTFYKDYVNKAKSPTAYDFMKYLLEDVPM